MTGHSTCVIKMESECKDKSSNGNESGTGERIMTQHFTKASIIYLANTWYKGNIDDDYNNI